MFEPSFILNLNKELILMRDHTISIWLRNKKKNDQAVCQEIADGQSGSVPDKKEITGIIFLIFQ